MHNLYVLHISDLIFALNTIYNNLLVRADVVCTRRLNAWHEHMLQFLSC